MGGIFQDYTKVFNRAPVSLGVSFDGQRYTIEPGADDLPTLTVPYAKNQNPVMGSQDPNNPQMDGAQYLIVEEGEAGYNEPMSKEEWEAHCNRPCRIDEESAFRERYGNDPKAKLVTYGKGKKTAAGNRYEAGGSPSGLAEFSRKD